MPKQTQTINGIAVTPSQADVYSVMADYGQPIPDHVLVPLAQHAVAHQSSSGIRTRRRELEAKGLVRDTLMTVKMPSGRSASLFEVA